ncbi:hypothetical protein EV122DRAFT_283309 [Schizophyllum commune]
MSSVDHAPCAPNADKPESIAFPPPSLDDEYDESDDGSDDEALEYPDVCLPESTEAYKLRTRVDKDAIDGAEKTTSRIHGIISHGVFQDDVFPVAPNEFIYGLDNLAYSVSNLHWLLDYPSLETPPGDREFAMASFLNRFVQISWMVHTDLGEPVPATPRQWIVTQTPRIMLNGDVEQCYGIALVDAGVEPQWRDVLCDVQMVPTPDRMQEAVHRISTGAANIFASQEDRIYHVGLAIAGDIFQLVYQDRAGRVLSKELDVHASAILFARIIIGLSLLPKSVGGKDDSIITRDGRRFVTLGGVEYEICERLAISRDLCGSGTICWRCRREGSDEDFVIKHIWVDVERDYTEGDLLRQVGRVAAVPDLVYEGTAIRADGRPWTTMWCDVLQPTRRCSSLAIVPQLQLHRLVLQPLARSLQDFASKEEFLEAFRDVVEAHQILYDDYDLLHCDISDNNIMLRKRDDSSPRRGLLIDLDCAIRVTSNDVSKTAFPGYRAGTLPFIAHELLLYRNVRHGPWHDLESFLYVLVFICATCAGPSRTRRRDFDVSSSPLAPWLSGDGEHKAKVMCRYNDDEFRAFLDSVFHPYFDDLKDLACDLRNVVSRRMSGRVHHRDVLDILDKCIESRRSAPRASLTTGQQSPSSPGASVDATCRPLAKRKRLSFEGPPSAAEMGVDSSTATSTSHRTNLSRSSTATERGRSDRTLVELGGGTLEKDTCDVLCTPKRHKSM